MRICIVGASSYVGGWIVNNLKQSDHEVSVVYRNEPITDHDWKSGLSNIIVGDVTDSTVLDKIINIEPEILIYLVSLNHKQSENNFFTTLNVNVSPLGYLVKSLTTLECFKRFIYFSTLQVIGKIKNGEVIDENSKPNPQNNYGLTHFFCEEILHMFNISKNFKYIIVRLANSYGPAMYTSCDSLWLVINDFCLSALNNNIIQLKSDGTPQRDFVYLDDVASAVKFIIDKNNEVPSIVNISSQKTMTMLELAHLTKDVCKNIGLNVKVMLPGGVESLDCKSHKLINKYLIKSWLYDSNFKINTNLEKGIRITIENFNKKNS